MPVYNYRCESCNEEIEEFSHVVSSSREVTVVCQKCGALAKRVLSTGIKYHIQAGHFFEPYVDTDITGDPIKIESHDQFVRECEKAGKGYRKAAAKFT